MRHKNMKRFLVFVLALVLIVGTAVFLTGCSDNGAKEEKKTEDTADDTDDDTDDNADDITPADADDGEEPADTTDGELSFGDTFEFDDLEITFGNELQWGTVENQFSEKNGMEAFSVPITITNKSDETHGLNMFYYTLYGPNGTKLESVGSYFDNNVDNAGDMRAGATQEALMHFAYEGDGDYYIEFSNFSDKIEVKLPIAK